MAEQNKQSFSLTYETVANLVLLLMRLLSVPAEMLLHVKIGERYLGVTGVLALILMGVYAAFFPGHESAMLGTLITVFTIRIVVHRLFCMHRRMRGGKPLHSRSTGTPLLSYLPLPISQQLIIWAEPIILIAVGAVITPSNRPLGSYLLWCGTGLMGMLMVRANIAYNKLLDLLDRQIEQQQLAADFKAQPAILIDS